MDYSILSEKEILKYADPVTDLEKALFKIISEGFEGVDEVQERCDSLSSELNDMEDRIHDLQYEIQQRQDAAEKVIELIGDQKLSNKSDVIDCLKEIIND